MELHEGKITTKELADWMGLSYTYFRSCKTEKLNYLRKYGFCDFKEVRGGIEVSKVYIPIFTKNIQEDDKVYVEEVLKAKDHLTSVAGMARKLKKENPSYSALDAKSIEYRMRKAGKRQFGKTYFSNDIKKDKGPCGTREYCWAIKLDDYNNYRYMTDEEKDIFVSLAKAYLTSDEGAQNFLEESLQADAGESMNAEKRVDIFQTNILIPFRQATGKTVARTTKHAVEESMAKRLIEQEE